MTTSIISMTLMVKASDDGLNKAINKLAKFVMALTKTTLFGCGLLTVAVGKQQADPFTSKYPKTLAKHIPHVVDGEKRICRWI